MRARIGMALLSGAMLLLQVALTRVFSIAQFYHFAFLVVSLALLGFGASGSLLVFVPRLTHWALGAWYALGFGLTTVLAYLFLNHLPFDSYSIAWDIDQVYLLAANLLGLAVPFVFAGALIGSLLHAGAADAGRIYGANLFGSAVGAVFAPIVLAAIGSERAVLLCAVCGAGAALLLANGQRLATFCAVGTLAISAALLALFPPLFEIQPSPYKQLSQFRLNPDARVLSTRQNAYARLDIIASSTIHSAPGLSLTYTGALPQQAGLLIDGDHLLPVLDSTHASTALAHALPAAITATIRPAGRVLVLGSGGGLDAWAALENGAQSVVMVEPNELVYDALNGSLRAWAGFADDPRVQLVRDEIRAYVQSNSLPFDIVQLALTDNYRPISSGAFTLTESYALTVEAFKSYLGLCGEDGVLVVTRWLQSPPSEELRTLGIIVTALDKRDPLAHLFVFRSFQTATFIVKPTPFTLQETSSLLNAIADLRYDLILAQVMPPDAINRYARLETPIYHDLFLELATTPDRAGFYAAYDFEVSPPTDDHPFFFHFFRWEQTPAVLQNLGRRWQPFGGSGYFVLIALLAFTLAAAILFVVIPIALVKRFRRALRDAGIGRSSRVLGYFAALGLAYLLVEVALIQRFMLVLARPTLALATVIGALLLFSGIGSTLSHRLSWCGVLAGLALVIALYPALTDALKTGLLSLPLALRVVAVIALIAPLGLLMGVPFARGIVALQDANDLIPWAWAVNGSASVISAVLATLLALSLGFTPVLLIGAGLYLAAAGLVSFPASAAQTPRPSHESSPPHHLRV